MGDWYTCSECGERCDAKGRHDCPGSHRDHHDRLTDLETRVTNLEEILDDPLDSRGKALEDMTTERDKCIGDAQAWCVRMKESGIVVQATVGDVATLIEEAREEARDEARKEQRDRLARVLDDMRQAMQIIVSSSENIATGKLSAPALIESRNALVKAVRRLNGTFVSVLRGTT